MAAAVEDAIGPVDLLVNNADAFASQQDVSPASVASLVSTSPPEQPTSFPAATSAHLATWRGW